MKKRNEMIYKPHGRTITPDLALPLPNIFRRLFSWYGRKMVFGFRSILQVEHTAETFITENILLWAHLIHTCMHVEYLHLHIYHWKTYSYPTIYICMLHTHL